MIKPHSFCWASLIFGIFVFLISAGFAKAQTVRSNNGLTDDEIKRLLAENKIPALGIGVIAGGKLTQVKVYGKLRKGEAAPFDTIFNVASLTKPVTAMGRPKIGKLGQIESKRAAWSVLDRSGRKNGWAAQKTDDAAHFVAPDRLSELALDDEIEKAGVRFRAGAK